MPATVADIAAAMREQAVDTQSSETIQARHAGARDTAANGASPPPSFWDNPAEAAIVNAARFALFGTERRRFSVPIDGIWPLAGDLDASQVTPTVALIAPELAADGTFLITRIEIDLDAETTTLELFG